MKTSGRRQKSEETAETAGALIVLIGPDWLTSQIDGKPRLHEPDDLVATEIKTALDSKGVIVPVLVQGASMPREEDLPDALKELARRNAVSVSDTNWALDTTRLAKVLAIDVRSAVERKLDWLRLVVTVFLVAPVLFSLTMIAYPDFREKALCTEDERFTYVLAINNTHWEWLKPKLDQKPKDQIQGDGESATENFRSELEGLRGDGGILPLVDILKKTLEDMTMITDEEIEEIIKELSVCCMVTLKDQKKAFTQAISSVNPFCIILVSLLLGLARTWIDPYRRKFIWATIAVGIVGVAGSFFYYLKEVGETPFLPSDEYFALVSNIFIITVMLGLLALSGFKPNDSIR